jgi:hypothetical protein
VRVVVISLFLWVSKGIINLFFGSRETAKY